MTKCKHFGCFKVIVERRLGRRGRPRLYCPEHQNRSARGDWSSRKRSYERCSHCQKVNELRWGDRKYCSAFCYGVGTQITLGMSLDEAESSVAAAIAADPSLVSRNPLKKPQRAMWCAQCGREGRCAYWCSGAATRATESGIIGSLLHDLPAVSVGESLSSLGGHQGPEEGRTSPHIVHEPVSKESAWHEANPEWWKRPSRITLYGMTLPVKVITFLNLAGLVSRELYAGQQLAA